MNPEKKQSNANSEDEIDLLALSKTIWLNKKVILVSTLIFIFLGLFVAFSSPLKFNAGSTFVPQIGEQNKVGGNLGGLASLAGINLGGMAGGSEIPPVLYPKIANSTKFKKALLDSRITYQGSKVTFREFYLEHYKPALLEKIKKYTIGLPGVIIQFLKKESTDSNRIVELDGSIVEITLEEFELFKLLEDKLQVSPNEKEGFVNISFTMPDPLMSAEMASHVEKLLQNEVISYKIQNAKSHLDFTEERFLEKKEEFEDIQKRLADFRDRNQNISSASMQNRLQQLESEYNFAFNIYTELAKQLEQAKLQVSKDTPIFSIIQPVTVPVEKSAPKRGLILVIFTFLGVIFGIGVILLRSYITDLKTNWNSIPVEKN